MTVSSQATGTSTRRDLRKRTRSRSEEASGQRATEVPARLLALMGPDAESVIAFQVPCVIGRSLGTDVLLRDILVSRWHARIERRGTGCVIHDLGSQNGTFVNEEQVQVAPLQDGDVIRVGRVELVFQDARGLAEPDPHDPA